jgi:drug/metabolite transporter (DMT)-like permease
MTGSERRIGAVHALGTDIAVFLFLGSLIARLRGRHTLGVGLGIVGNIIVAGAGFLGGHLALTQGTARRTT